MKKVLLFLTFISILSFTNLYSQLEFYGANDYFDSISLLDLTIDTGYYSSSSDLDFNNAEPKVYNVHFYYLINTSNPTTDYGEDEALDKIAALNIAFNPYKIFFKYRGFSVYGEYYNGSQLINASHDVVQERMSQIAENDGNNDKINIILFKENCNNDKGSANLNFKNITLRYCTAGRHQVIYQMGHLFGLFQTEFGTGSSLETIPMETPCNAYYPNELVIPDYSQNATGEPENVTRDINNPYYNANDAGDYVTDTPACFRASSYNYCHQYSSSTYDYISHPLIVDDSPEHLMFEYVDILNYMSLSYDNFNWGLKHFTLGQGVRMRETIAIPSLNFPQVETTVESLYVPYYVYDGAGDVIISSTDLGNGFIEVCRNLVHIEYFQPGFDYNFDYNGSTHYDAAFVIPIFDLTSMISVNIEQLGDAVFQSGTSCTRGQVCVEEPITGGKVTSFTNINDPNFTIDNLDKPEASDPNLIQDLENNKFHTIEKISETGQKTEETIYKGN